VNGDPFTTKLIGNITGISHPTIPVFQSLSIYSDSLATVQVKLEYPNLLGSKVDLYLLTLGEIASGTKIYINGSYVLSESHSSGGTPFPF
jgi:hypothetical protein